MTKPTIRIHSIDDAVTAAPRFLGYRPHEDLVILVIDPALTCTVRASLDQLRTSRGIRRQLGGLRDQYPDADLLLIAFTDRIDEGLDTLHAVADMLGSSRIMDAVATDGQRWWSFHCENNPQCHDGHELLISEDVVSATTAAGMTVADSRETLAARVAGPDVQTMADERAASADAQQWAASANAYEIAALMATVTDGGEIDTTTALRLAHLLTYEHVAVALWKATTADMAARLLPVWTAVVAHAPAPVAVGPLMMCGQAAWLTGDGALESCTLERAARLDSHHLLFQALENLELRGVAPFYWQIIDHDPAVIATGDPVKAASV